MPDNGKLNMSNPLQALFLLNGLKNGDFSFSENSAIMGIDVNAMLEQLTMINRIQQAKNMHKYPIYHTEKSGWFTNVDDPTRPGGKRKIRKASEEKLLEALAAWYLDNSNKDLSLAEIYERWLEWKRTPKNESTIKRLEVCWKSYYLNRPLSQDIINKPMRKLTSLELRTWAEALLKEEYPVDKKKFSRMFQIVKECFEYTSDEDIGVVEENVWLKAKKKINQSLIVPIVTPPDETQVFTDEERILIKQMVYDDLEKYKNRPTSAGLQILFMFETGLRIGECCGLKWSDIKNGRLYIQRQANNNEVVEWPKTTSGYRDIPLTKEALRILDDVKKYNEEHNFNGEWIFQSGSEKYDGRLSYNATNNKLSKLCERLESQKRTAHKIRKTTLSALLDSPDISNRTVQRFAGHSDITTTQRYYNFERRSREEQAKAIDEALSLETED